MSLSPSDLRHIEYAKGFLILDALEKANEELDNVAPELRSHPDVLGVRLAIHERGKKWPMCVELARHLAKVQPKETSWPLALAFATRRSESLLAAQAILREAEGRFPRAAAIKFNLACYAAQLGELEEAKCLVKAAIALDRSLQKEALDDPDLEPIWRSLGKA